MAESPQLLSSRQMASFVADGYLRFDGVVPAALCERALAELAAGAPPATALGPVLELPRVSGAVASLVGPDPIHDHHYAHVIAPRQRWSQPWHADAIIDPRKRAFDIQLMFFFHDTPREMGGTMILPGSHLRMVNEAAIARYQNFVGQQAIACPAGSLVIVHHGIWHCGQPNLTDRARTMFKLRLAPRVPQRRLWDTGDLADPEARAAINKTLARDHGWYGHELRLEITNRIRLWRVLTDDPRFDFDSWLTRVENQA